MPLEIILSEEQIQVRIRELSQEIRRDYGDEQLLLVAVLKGSFLFLADLARALDREVQIDFVQVSSYGDGKESSGIVQIRKDLDINIEGLNVLIVEDIVDTGATLDHLRALLSTRRPKSLKVISLLSKPEARKKDTKIEYVGFPILDGFVVGYGLDYAERFRSLPYIAILHDE